MAFNALRPLTREARDQVERFKASYQALLQKAQNAALDILIWGPGYNSKSLLGENLRSLVQVLRQHGHNAMTAEDLYEPDSSSLVAREFAQALSADLIIVLLGESPGALAEVHDYCNNPNIAPKIFLMIPKKFEGHYSSQGAIRDLSEGYGGVYWYRDAELRSGKLLKRALDRAEALRHLRFRMERDR